MDRGPPLPIIAVALAAPSSARDGRCWRPPILQKMGCGDARTDREQWNPVEIRIGKHENKFAESTAWRNGGRPRRTARAAIFNGLRGKLENWTPYGRCEIPRRWNTLENMMEAENIAEARDEIESAIIMALHMDKTRVAAKGKPGRRGGWVKEEIGMETFCPKEPAFPRCAYTFDARSGDRIYAADMTGVVVNPIAAIGHRLETMMLCEDGVLKWSCIKPMPRPKGITALTNQPHQWFCYHFRTFARGKPQDYVKRPMALTQSGDVCPITPIGKWGFNPQADRVEMETQLAMTLSIFEDAHRAGAFLACVEEHVQLMFPIGSDEYRSFLIMRDGYTATPTGRKNPILHWCAEHFRRRNGKTSVVSEHLRGAEEFIVGPMRLTISASEGYGAFLGATRPAPAAEGTE